MSKKKPTKKNDPQAEIRAACQSIVDDLYAEVERVHGRRAESLEQRVDDLKREMDAATRECGHIVGRLIAVESRTDALWFQRSAPKSWLGRMGRWFRLPW